MTDSITQAEFSKRFIEYMKTQKPGDNEDPKYWYVGKLIDFARDLESQGLTVRAGLSVDESGKVTYEIEK